MKNFGRTTMKHLLNCKECDWHTVVEGPSCVADVERESHEMSIRNWRSRTTGAEFCSQGSVAWVML